MFMNSCWYVRKCIHHNFFFVMLVKRLQQVHVCNNVCNFTVFQSQRYLMSSAFSSIACVLRKVCILAGGPILFNIGFDHSFCIKDTHFKMLGRWGSNIYI